VRRMSVLVVPAVLAILCAFGGNAMVAGDPDGGRLESAAFAVGGGLYLQLSIACVQAIAAAGTACSQAGIAGAVGCALSVATLPQSCP